MVLPFASMRLARAAASFGSGRRSTPSSSATPIPPPVARLRRRRRRRSTALLGSTLKIEGRFQLQTKSDGPVAMLLVDFDAPSNLRALARFDKARLERAPVGGDDLLGRGHLAFTIDPGGDMTRYQGVDRPRGSGAGGTRRINYFERSEQIPTLVRLAVGEMRRPRRPTWRAGGLIVQYLPAAGAARRGRLPSRRRAGGGRTAPDRRGRRLDGGQGPARRRPRRTS